MHIPKILHQIWIQGKDLIPTHLRQIQNTWKSTHPDMEIRVWDEAELWTQARKLNSRWLHILDSYDLSLIQRADIWRCMILEEWGGTYADLDMWALKNIYPILDHDKICLGRSHSSITRVQNSILASAPHHPGWEIVHNSIYRSLHTQTLLDDLSPSFNVLHTTGPIAWTRAVDQHAAYFCQWPAEYFFSKHVHKGKLRLDTDAVHKLADSYGYHVQEISWMRGHEAALIHCITAWFNTRPELKTLLLTSALCFIYGILELYKK